MPCTVFHAKNKGYSHGVNEGIKKAIKEGFEAFVVINSDVVVKANFVENVLDELNKKPKCLIGGKIYYAKGYEFHKDKYRDEDLGKVIWYAGGTIDWANMYISHRGVDQVDTGQFDNIEETEFITGCLVCFDKEAFETIGPWNEKYFLYYEDSDFCERAKQKGYKLIFDPDIIIWHKNAQSTDGSGSALHQKYQEKNRIIFALKYAPLRTRMHVVKNFLFDKILRKK
jgi:GT2 family glycosyltransferase